MSRLSRTIDRALCLLGRHQYIPVAWVTCRPGDLGNVCRFCLKEGPRLYPDATTKTAQGMSAFGRDPQGHEAKPASPVLPQEGCAHA